MPAPKDVSVFRSDAPAIGKVIKTGDQRKRYIGKHTKSPKKPLNQATNQKLLTTIDRSFYLCYNTRSENE